MGTRIVPYRGSNLPLLMERCLRGSKLRFKPSRSNVLMKKWHAKYYFCTSCEQTTKPHFAKGLCKRCYMRAYRKENPPVLLRKVLQRESTAEARMRDYVGRNLHTEYSPHKVQIHHNGTTYYLYPLDQLTQGIEVDVFRALVD